MSSSPIVGRGGVEGCSASGPPSYSSYSYCHSTLGSEVQGSFGVLICLNSDTFTLPLLRRVWNSCSVRILADGAANRLFSWRKILKKVSTEGRESQEGSKRQQEQKEAEVEDEDEDYVPEYIKGDLDSLSQEAGDFYRSRGVKIIHSSCQDTNDFEKCIDLALELFDDGRRIEADMRIVVCGAFGGRLDHELSHYHVCYKTIKCFRDNAYLTSNTSGSISDDFESSSSSSSGGGSVTRKLPNFSKKSFSIYMVSSSSIAIVLSGGWRHVIHVPFPKEKVVEEVEGYGKADGNVDQLAPAPPSAISSSKVSCGLIPLFGEVSLVTLGLKWNLSPDSESLQMGKFISSSNSVLPPLPITSANTNDNAINDTNKYTSANTAAASTNVSQTQLLCKCRGNMAHTSVVDIIIENPDQAVLWTCEYMI